MSVDTRITLPFSAQSRHIAQVAGILAGCRPVQWEPYPDVKGAKLLPGSHFDPSMLTLELEAAKGTTLIDGKGVHFCHLHTETGDGAGKVLSPRRSLFWIALGIGLADFFGGDVDFSDCDTNRVDYRAPLQENRTEGGHGDDRYGIVYGRMRLVRPLTTSDLTAAARAAA